MQNINVLTEIAAQKRFAFRLVSAPKRRRRVGLFHRARLTAALFIRCFIDG